MYSFQRALALSRSIGSQWTEVDLSDQLVFDIFQSYTKVFLVLSNTNLTEDVFVDMDSLRSLYSSYDDTLDKLLLSLGNTTLATVPSLPNAVVKYAKYANAFRSGYKIETTVAGMQVPEGYPSSELKDLKITRPLYSTDMQLLEDYCLLSVNGYYHWNETASGVAYAFDGGTTMRKSKLNHMGIYSFLDVGKLTKIKLDPARIVPVTAGTQLRDKINFTVDESLEGKSYILVMGGYMVFPQEGVFWRSGQSGFTLDINRVFYKERLLESSQYIDLSPMGLTRTTIGDNVYSIDELTSDERIRKYLTLSQSFLVLVDTPNLVANKLHIRHSALPGMFTAYQDPVYPLVVGFGKNAEYWKTKEGNAWSVNVQDSYMRNYVVSEQATHNGQLFTDHLASPNLYFHGRGFLLELAGYRS